MTDALQKPCSWSTSNWFIIHLIALRDAKLWNYQLRKPSPGVARPPSNSFMSICKYDVRLYSCIKSTVGHRRENISTMKWGKGYWSWLPCVKEGAMMVDYAVCKIYFKGKPKGTTTHRTNNYNSSYNNNKNNNNINNKNQKHFRQNRVNNENWMVVSHS